MPTKAEVMVNRKPITNNNIMLDGGKVELGAFLRSFLSSSDTTK
jgi:hypothetical protein